MMSLVVKLAAAFLTGVYHLYTHSMELIMRWLKLTYRYIYKYTRKIDKYK